MTLKRIDKKWILTTKGLEFIFNTWDEAFDKFEEVVNDK